MSSARITFPDDALYLIDASIYIFRAWFSYPDTLHDPLGAPVNAVYGYTQFLCQLLERIRPGHVAAAFDLSLTSSFRNRIYPPYKANRELPPAELERQMALCREVTDALGITVYASESFEADDLIGTAAHCMRKEGFPVVLVSADKDLAQLLEAGDHLWDFARDRREDPAAVEQRLGVPPALVADLLALTGDSVDNIPGVPGVGPKTGSALLSQFGGLDALMDDLQRVPECAVRGAKRLQGCLDDYRDQLVLARKLTQIRCDAPIDCCPLSLRWDGPNANRVAELFDEFGFGPGLRQRCLRL
jgi:5'-3' exonuclease